MAISTLLNNKIRLIIISLRLPDVKSISLHIKEKDCKDTAEKLLAKKLQPKGQEFLSSENNVIVAPLIADLAEANYVLVDAFYQMRHNEFNKYALVRFTLVLKEFENSSEEFSKIRPEVEASLLKLVNESSWRVKGHINPFYENGQEAEDVYSMALDLNSRQPMSKKSIPCVRIENSDIKIL